MNTIETVEKVLTSSCISRDDDTACVFLTLAGLGHLDYVEAIALIRKLKDAPSFETITRARRYIQAHNCYLRPSPEATKKRRKRELEYRDTKGNPDKKRYQKLF